MNMLGLGGQSVNKHLLISTQKACRLIAGLWSDSIQVIKQALTAYCEPQCSCPREASWKETPGQLEGNEGTTAGQAFQASPLLVTPAPGQPHGLANIIHQGEPSAVTSSLTQDTHPAAASGPERIRAPADALLSETSGAGLTGCRPSMESSVQGAGQMAFLSNLLAAYSFITEHPERAALCFVSGVCVGLLLTLAALVLTISCRADCQQPHGKKGLAGRQSRSSDLSDSDSASDEDSSGGCSGSSDGSTHRPWLFERPPHRNVFTSAEELERAQRLEERERIIREIWLNGQPDGPAPAPATRSLNRYY
ncbi:protein eva-1 homolog A isoform X2 [Petaurus breviceps papuanus]|uniref:protein eva-1 homolog A isoform X2 n=1 Tax=Petaurus breviceps papuanus TaxID=3040969 RepID=UPI0036DB0C18